MAVHLDPQLVQSLTVTLVQNLTFKNGSFYRNLLFNFSEDNIKIVFSEKYTGKKRK